MIEKYIIELLGPSIATLLFVFTLILLTIFICFIIIALVNLFEERKIK